MDRNVRKLFHAKSADKPLVTRVPTAGEMAEGEERYCFVNGKPRLYKKMNGILCYWEGVTV